MLKGGVGELKLGHDTFINTEIHNPFSFKDPLFEGGML